MCRHFRCLSTLAATVPAVTVQHLFWNSFLLQCYSDLCQLYSVKDMELVIEFSCSADGLKTVKGYIKNINIQF